MSVQTHLSNLASALVLSEAEKGSISTSISTVQRRLTNYFGAQVKEHVQFGSSTRATMLPRKADENSDVDYMVIFDNGAGLKPQSFLDRLKRFAEGQYPSSEIHQSHPTLVLELNHIKFELVPAYKDWLGTIKIPSSSAYTDWISTDPTGFNNSLVSKNRDNKDLIKPLVRLMKYWNAKNGYVYESYALEQAIVGAWYWGCSSLKDYFFEAISDLSTWNHSAQWKKDKVVRAKELVAKVKGYEADGYAALAQSELQKLLPSLSSISAFQR